MLVYLVAVGGLLKHKPSAGSQAWLDRLLLGSCHALERVRGCGGVLLRLLDEGWEL